MRKLPKKCSEVQASLPLFVGRDLELIEIEAVKAHLAECAVCRRELEAAESARNALLALHGAELDDEPTFEWSGTQPVSDLAIDLWPGIEAQLAAEGLLADARESLQPVAETSGLRLLTGGGMAWVGAAAAVSLLVWFGLFANRVPDSKPAPIAHVEKPAPVVSEPVLSMQGVDLAAKTMSGGLRPIDRSEGLSQRARIFDLDTPTNWNQGLQPENPNAAVGLRSRNFD